LAVDSGVDLRVLSLAGENIHEARERLKELVGRGVNYFYVELHEGTLLAHPLSQGEKLPMQFGREVRLTMTQCLTLMYPISVSCIFAYRFTMPGSGSTLVVLMQ